MSEDDHTIAHSREQPSTSL